MSEKLCLQWNDFQDNIKSAFRNLREDKDFADVTLACEDGQQVEAHKVILAASSPFFQKLLGRNKHAHLLIYMRGMKSVDLVAIVDFLYCEEANVFQENLDSFLAIAEELQLIGLMGKVGEKVDNFSVNEEPVIDTNSKISKTQLRGHTSSSSRTPKTEENRAVAIPVNSSVDLDNLEERVRSMMGKSQNDYANGLRKADLCKV